VMYSGASGTHALIKIYSGTFWPGVAWQRSLCSCLGDHSSRFTLMLTALSRHCGREAEQRNRRACLVLWPTMFSFKCRLYLQMRCVQSVRVILVQWLRLLWGGRRREAENRLFSLGNRKGNQISWKHWDVRALPTPVPPRGPPAYRGEVCWRDRKPLVLKVGGWAWG
jgi:hypothetical protein